VVEYAILLAKITGNTFASLTQTAELWLSRVNWELVGYVVLGLVALRFVTWTLKPR
jgi:hypothetical protein